MLHILPETEIISRTSAEAKIDIKRLRDIVGLIKIMDVLTETEAQKLMDQGLAIHKILSTYYRCKEWETKIMIKTRTINYVNFISALEKNIKEKDAAKRGPGFVRRNRHLESDIQKACVEWFSLQFTKYSLLLFAVPNGGTRNAREAASMKKEGIVRGVSDLILLVGRKGFNSLCIEMKTKEGRQSPGQRKWQKAAESQNNKYILCHSLDEFMRQVKEYLDE